MPCSGGFVCSMFPLWGCSAGRARHSVRAVRLVEEACRGLPALPHRPKACVPLPQIRAKFHPPMYPNKLDKIINLFESLPEDERRETLVSYADNAKKQEPREGENFDLVDVRKDEECTDTVGVYLHVDENGSAHIRMTLGPEVQTLTRSM